MLRQSLSDWTDLDVAQYAVGVALGVFATGTDFPTHAKPLLWTSNPVGEALKSILDALVLAGALLYRDEPDYQYRWNPDFTAG